jgi:glucan phosphorylase
MLKLELKLEILKLRQLRKNLSGKESNDIMNIMQVLNQDMHSNKEHIAYFTMEIGISHSIPTYSGGLGILAGDLMKAYADLKVPVVCITLLNEKGYFQQSVDSEGNQIERPVQWNPADFM